MKNDDLIYRLDSVYNQAINSATRKNFFLWIFEYFNLLYNEPRLSFIFNVLKKQKEKDLKEINKIIEKALNELRRVFKEVKQFVEENKINSIQLLEELKEFESLERGTMQTTGDEIEFRYENLKTSLYYLLELKQEKYIKFCKKYAHFNKDIKNIEWIFSPHTEKYLINLPKIGRLKLSATWYAFDKLNEYYRYYIEIENIQKRAVEENNFFEIIGLVYLKEDINSILKDENKSLKFIKAEDCRFWFDKLHFFVKDCLLKPHDEKEKKYLWEYDPVHSIFKINKKTVKFKKESFRTKILDLLTKNERNSKRIWSWDEIIEKIENLDDQNIDTKLQTKVYDACRDINEQIASKTGITNFLIVNTQNIRINPLYL